MTTAPSPETVRHGADITSPIGESVRDFRHSPDITQAAMWLADQSGRPANVRYLIQSRFGLTDADAAEAILLAGDFSVVRRAFE